MGAPGSRSTSEYLKRLHGLGLTQIELVPDPPPAPRERLGCERCDWHGFVVGDPEVRGVGQIIQRAKPCPFCKEPEIAAKQLSLVFGNAGIPVEYQRVTFQSYAKLPIWNPSYQVGDQTIIGSQPAALAAAQEFADLDEGSMLLYGFQKGAGKTALSVCIQRSIVERTHCNTLFITMLDLLDRIRGTYSSRSEISEDEILSAVRSTDLLVLDDAGRTYKKDGPAGEWVTGKVYSIVNWRQTHHLRTIYTSNSTLEELDTIFDDATAWRIKDHVDKWIVLCEGCNLRDLTREEREKAML